MSKHNWAAETICMCLSDLEFPGNNCKEHERQPEKPAAEVSKFSNWFRKSAAKVYPETNLFLAALRAASILLRTWQSSEDTGQRQMP